MIFDLLYKKKMFRLRTLYVAAFLFAVSCALLGYVLSSYIASFVGKESVGLYYTVAYLVTLLGINVLPNVLKKNSVVVACITILSLTAISILCMGLSSHLAVVLIAFVTFTLMNTLGWITFDILLERNSINAITGGIRGMYLTVVNLGWVVAPFASGFLIDKYSFQTVFIVAGILVIPALTLISTNFRYKTLHLFAHSYSPIAVFKKVWGRKNIRNVFIAEIFLKIFFSVMVIYTPIYLNTSVGLPWSSIGIIFTIMLLPYVLVEYGAGKLADLYWGEKEMLAFGFVITAASTLLMYYTDSKSVIIWAAILFATRVGTSFIESMSEIYFFKKVDGGDIDIINFFRNSRPLAYIIAPPIFSLILIRYPMDFIFFILGIVMLLPLYFVIQLKDTK